MFNFGMMLAMGPMPAADGSTPEGSSISMLVWLVLMGALMYFLLIRPSRRREKERQALLSAVKTGDRVLLSGGILGVVANVKEKILVVKIADGVKIEVVRGAISQILDKNSVPEDENQK